MSVLKNLPIELEPIREELEALVLPLVRIKAAYPKEGETIQPWQSHFKGFPYLLKSQEFPTDSKGNPLFLLAQINFDELSEKLPDFPTTGILQIFVSTVNKSVHDIKYKINYIETYTQNINQLQTDFSFINYGNFTTEYFYEFVIEELEKPLKINFSPLSWEVDNILRLHSINYILLRILNSQLSQQHKEVLTKLGFDYNQLGQENKKDPFKQNQEISNFYNIKFENPEDRKTAIEVSQMFNKLKTELLKSRVGSAWCSKLGGFESSYRERYDDTSYGWGGDVLLLEISESYNNVGLRFMDGEVAFIITTPDLINKNFSNVRMEVSYP
jgi:uncharacterized protein YwqG